MCDEIESLLPYMALQPVQSQPTKKQYNSAVGFRLVQHTILLLILFLFSIRFLFNNIAYII